MPNLTAVLCQYRVRQASCNLRIESVIIFYLEVDVAQLIGWWQMSADMKITFQLYVSMENIIDMLCK